MASILAIIQVVLSILLMAVILIQQKGAGLGAAFGGGGGSIATTKRGIDKILHHITIVISILFFALGLLQVIL